MDDAERVTNFPSPFRPVSDVISAAATVSLSADAVGDMAPVVAMFEDDYLMQRTVTVVVDSVTPSVALCVPGDEPEMATRTAIASSARTPQPFRPKFRDECDSYGLSVVLTRSIRKRLPAV